jgi:hypothetical protein
MESPDIEPPHHLHTGRTRLDVVLGISAVSISLMSLFLAIQNDKAMEHLVQANSWPFVQISYSTLNADGSPHVHMDIANKGVGPASIQSLEFYYQGKHLSGIRAIADAVLNRTTVSEKRPLISDVVNTVLSAKEIVSFIDFVPVQKFTTEDYATITSNIGKMEFKGCYCSVFDECWIVESSTPRPSKVKSCPVERPRSE